MTGFGKDKRGVILKFYGVLATGTLASRTAVVIDQLALTEDFRLLKAEIFPFGAIASVLDVGMYLIGDGALTLAEVKEAMDVEGPLQRNDTPNNEHVMRPVWPICTLTNDIVNTLVVPNEGNPVIWKKRWTFSNDNGITIWMFNPTGNAFTDGGSFGFQATLYGVWLD